MDATLPSTYKLNVSLRLFVWTNTAYQGVLDSDCKSLLIYSKIYTFKKHIQMKEVIVKKLYNLEQIKF